MNTLIVWASPDKGRQFNHFLSTAGENVRKRQKAVSSVNRMAPRVFTQIHRTAPIRTKESAKEKEHTEAWLNGSLPEIFLKLIRRALRNGSQT